MSTHTLTTRLALDCSFSGLSLTLLTSAGGTYAFSTTQARSSDLLPTELANLFQVSATTAAQLTHIYVTTGPGSFTGIRLGLATAEALKLVNPALHIIGLSTLQALATQILAEHQPATSFTILLDAAGGQVYTQTFSPQGAALTPATCQPLAELPTHHAPRTTVFAQSTLLIDATPLTPLTTSYLFTLAEDPATHLPATPVYLKPLTYKLAL